jgi:hypothetical protein
VIVADQFELFIPKAREICAGLSRDQFVWRPGPGAWSVAECLDHLNTSNRMYLAQIGQAIQDGRAAGLTGSGPFGMGWLEQWFVKSLEPPVSIRVKAPSKFAPRTDLSLGAVIDEWESSHRQGAQLARSAEGLHLTKVHVPSPALRLVKMSLLAAFHLIPAHDRRHLWQASRVVEQMRASSSARA